MATIHISQADAARDLYGLLSRLDEHTSFIIEGDAAPIAVLQVAPPRPLTLDERIALLPRHNTEGIDDTFAADLNAAIDSRREPYESTRLDG